MQGAGRSARRFSFQIRVIVSRQRSLAGSPDRPPLVLYFMKAFILAAGFGTRLWPLTEDRTKAAIPFLNRPLIAYSVEYLALHGIREIIINLHHQPDSIRDALGDGSSFGVKLTYSFEEEILGTSGALDRVRELLLGEDFLVVNGKIITNIDLKHAIAEHQKRHAIGTLVLRQNAKREHFSTVEVDERGWITRFAGFPDVASQAAIANAPSDSSPIVSTAEPAPLMFTGIQVLSPKIFEYIPRGVFSHSTIHAYPRAIAAGEAVIGHLSTRDWYEMSTVARYLEASLRLKADANASVVAGASCTIAEGAVVERAVLWNNVTIERGARVRECVIGEGVRLPAGSLLERAVVVRRDIVREIERGELVGENLIVPIG